MKSALPAAPVAHWLTVVALLLPVFSCGGSGALGAGSCNFQRGGNCSLVVNGVPRSYVLHVPANFHANASALLIAFHGSKGSGSQFESYTGLSTKADAIGFAVAYPDGLPNAGGIISWSGYFSTTSGTNPPDDSGFARQLILVLEANLHPDPKKIYVTGMSAGGYMAHRAAIDHADLIAAAGVVEGSLWVQAVGGTQQPPPANAPVSVLVLHGDADPVINYCGVTTATVTAASQDQTFNYWFQTPANSCTTLNTTTNLCTGFAGSPNPITMKDATGCKSGTEVRFYRLVGGTHTWNQTPLNVAPGTALQPYNPNLNSATGVTTNDILWNFFASHAKP